MKTDTHSDGVRCRGHGVTCRILSVKMLKKSHHEFMKTPVNWMTADSSEQKILITVK